MSVFIAKKIKEARVNAHMTQEEAAMQINISRNRLAEIETNKRQVFAEEIVQLSEIYGIDVRELLLEQFVEESEEVILARRYSSFLKIIDQLSDRDKEDVYWVLSKRVKDEL